MRKLIDYIIVEKCIICDKELHIHENFAQNIIMCEECRHRIKKILYPNTTTTNPDNGHNSFYKTDEKPQTHWIPYNVKRAKKKLLYRELNKKLQGLFCTNAHSTSSKQGEITWRKKN